MNLRLSVRTKLLAVALVAVSMLILAGGALQASNMGFKMNKVIYAQGGAGSGVGDNFTALPFRNPYQNAGDVCSALGIPAGGTIQQIDAQFGTPFNFTCGGGSPFALLQRVGVRARSASLTGGILVGSHAGGPPGVTFHALGGPPTGDNHFPVLYHGTAATAQDVCSQAGLAAGTSTIQRIDAQFGTPVNHTCGGGAPFALVLGESVRVRTTTLVSGFVPPHF